MGKTGWQVTTAIFGSLALLLGAAAWNTSRALDVANAQLSARDEAITEPSAPPDGQAEWQRRALAEIEAAKHAEPALKWAEGAECIGGALVRRTKDGWESVSPPDGRSTRCVNVPPQ